LHNPGGYEVVGAEVKVKGYERRFVIFGCYMPPSLDAHSSRECMQLLVDITHEAKRKLNEPYLVIAGDFNQFNPAVALKEHPDVKEAVVGATRRGKKLDRIFTNFNKKIIHSKAIAPLQPDVGTKGADSDHKVGVILAELDKRESSKWTTYWTRKYSEKKAEKFGNWLKEQNWEEVFAETTSVGKAAAYQSLVEGALEKKSPGQMIDSEENEEGIERSSYAKVGRRNGRS
jgi:hypothetical protein